MPEITGLAHVDLSVTDLDRSETWYTSVLGAKSIAAQRVDDPGYDLRVLIEPRSQTLLALFKHDGDGGGTFDFRRTGMDHFAFGVDGLESLAAWKDHLTSLGVTHNGIETDPVASSIVAKDPDGIPVEFYHFAAADQLAAMLAG